MGGCLNGWVVYNVEGFVSVCSRRGVNGSGGEVQDGRYYIGSDGFSLFKKKKIQMIKRN